MYGITRAPPTSNRPPRPRRLSVTLPPRHAATSGFEQNIQAGLTSETFDLKINVAQDDAREGLADTEIIERIMKENKCDFDAARVILVRERMIAAGVDPDTGLPIDTKALSFDGPRNKVTIYNNKNMVCNLIGDPNGDGYIGKAKTLQEAVDMAVAIPDAAFFTWHSPQLHNEWSERVFVFSNKKARIYGRCEPRSWPIREHHVTGVIERLGVEQRTPVDGDSGPKVVDVEVYDRLNMVNGKIRNEHSDGYAGIARTLNEAVDIACQLYDDNLGGGVLYFSWHEPDVNTVKLFGIALGESAWACRVYAWTEERARDAGRVDIKSWVPQDGVTSGKIQFKKPTAEALIQETLPPSDVNTTSVEAAEERSLEEADASQSME